MKICFVTHRFYPNIGGVETHVYEIARRIARRVAEKFSVEIITADSNGFKEFEEIEGMLIRRFKSFSPKDAYYFSPSLYRYLKKNSVKYDIIHAHNYHAFPALFASLAKRNKFVFTPHYHGFGHSFFKDLLHKPYKLIGKKIFERADAIICVSEYERNLVLRNFKIDKDKIYVIPNGVNLEEFEGIGKKENRDRDVKKILYVGRVERYKGLDYVVKALKHLPDFILEVVGDGNYKPNVVRLAEKMGVIDRVRFYHDLDRKELVKKYVDADVFVLLSKHEAYGIVVAEALAAKTPCIVANTSALSEWIDNKNVFGINYPIDVKTLSDLIIKTSQTSVKNVKLLSWDEVSQRVLEIYTS